MLTEPSTPSLWLIESVDSLADPSPYATFDKQTYLSYYPTRSLYKAETLINGHLQLHWNTGWTKVVAVNQLIVGLSVLMVGLVMIFCQLALSSTGHGVWTGVLIFASGLLAFFTVIYRQHRYFLFVAGMHMLAGLLSTIMIFISVFAVALQFNDHPSLTVRSEDRQLNYGLHFTLIFLGLYEKLLCYTFLIMIIRHTHKMV